jgi:hypothetical protein
MDDSLSCRVRPAVRTMSRGPNLTVTDYPMGSSMSPRDDPKLLDVGSDVVVRFKGHGSYKGEAGALKAMRRRAPGFSDEEYRAAFDMLSQVYDRAVDAIRRHWVHRPEKKSRFSEFEDIDHDACMRELETIEPGVAIREKWQILNWVIFWHYLK